ncbi:MAG TPA: hypothetical protein VGI06_16450 [Acidimicrobiales bacterium]|jgi:hypothetical protein
MRYRFIAALAAVAVGGGMILATAQQAGASQEFSVVAHQTNFEFVPAGGAATANPNLTAPAKIGDEIIVRESLSQGGVEVGYDNVVCTDTFNNNALCNAVLVFNGKGDLHGTALIRNDFDPSGNGPTVFDATIDGGTFAYASARGMVHLIVQPNGDSQDNIILS